mmetsp:Transcript_85861/g.241608  ORF Transcript_85861/g.241608 Transcript_85861/m.241608 type:complete len:83 (+) Transcript_85861:143-391(+)
MATADKSREAGRDPAVAADEEAEEDGETEGETEVWVTEDSSLTTPTAFQNSRIWKGSSPLVTGRRPQECSGTFRTSTCRTPC